MQCQQCNTSFIYRLVQNKYGICEPNTTALVPLTCNADQYYCFITKACQSCPIGCASCTQSFLTGEPTIKCSKCSDDFTWYTDYKCYKKCPAAQVSYFDASGAQQCRNCADNCLNCDIDYSVSPPSEVCFKCGLGFYLYQAKCVAEPQCVDRQFLQFTKIQNQYLSFNASCNTCPPSCLSCKSTNQYEPYAPITCDVCAANYVLDPTNNQCIFGYLNKESDVDCGKDTGLYKFLLKRALQAEWICGECDAGCLSCEAKYCFKCNSTYYLVTPAATNDTPKCQPIDKCNATQYFTIENKCQNCPSECTACSVSNLQDPQNTFTCSACATGFAISPDGKCLKTVTDDQIINSTLCPSTTAAAKYPALINGFVQCFDCPASCLACELSNPKQENSALKCTLCISGY